MMCDGAGWHDERALTVPDNVTLALLPYSPELKSSGFGSTYANASYRSASSTTPRPSSTPVAKHGDLIAEPDRMRTLCAYPWIMKVIS